MADTTAEVTDLLQHLIRNQCVNDGRPESGNEAANAELLASYLEGAGLETERYDSAPGRANELGCAAGGIVCGAPPLDLLRSGASGFHQARMSFTTLPSTSVSRKSRPWKR